MPCVLTSRAQLCCSRFSGICASWSKLCIWHTWDYGRHHCNATSLLYSYCMMNFQYAYSVQNATNGHIKYSRNWSIVPLVWHLTHKKQASKHVRTSNHILANKYSISSIFFGCMTWRLRHMLTMLLVLTNRWFWRNKKKTVAKKNVQRLGNRFLTYTHGDIPCYTAFNVLVQSVNK